MHLPPPLLPPLPLPCLHLPLSLPPPPLPPPPHLPPHLPILISLLLPQLPHPLLLLLLPSHPPLSTPPYLHSTPPYLPLVQLNMPYGIEQTYPFLLLLLFPLIQIFLSFVLAHKHCSRSYTITKHPKSSLLLL